MFYENIKKLMIASVLMQISFSAYCDNQIERITYNPWEAEIGYSQVVIAGNTLYLSGIASNKPTMKEQVNDIYSLIQNTLQDNGLGMEHVVKQVIYTTDIESFKNLTTVRKEWFPDGKFPSSTLVEVRRLYSPKHLVEIEVVAFRAKNKKSH